MRRMRVRNTPAELKRYYRAEIAKLDGFERAGYAWAVMYRTATDEGYFYTNAQLAAIATGLNLGMTEGIR